MNNLVAVANREALKESNVDYTPETIRKYYYTGVMPKSVIVKLRGRLYLNLSEFEKWLYESTTKNSSNSAS